MNLIRELFIAFLNQLCNQSFTNEWLAGDIEKNLKSSFFLLKILEKKYNQLMRQ